MWYIIITNSFSLSVSCVHLPKRLYRFLSYWYCCVLTNPPVLLYPFPASAAHLKNMENGCLRCHPPCFLYTVYLLNIILRIPRAWLLRAWFFLNLQESFPELLRPANTHRYKSATQLRGSFLYESLFDPLCRIQTGYGNVSARCRAYSSLPDNTGSRPPPLLR